MPRPMNWIPVNVSPETLRKVEAYSRHRRIGRAEAAGLLLEAGVEALQPVVGEELEEQRRQIRARLLPTIEQRKAVAQARQGNRDLARLEEQAECLAKAIEEPDDWCIHEECKWTNWGGRGRLHMRGNGCPAFDSRRTSHALAQIERRITAAKG